MPIDPELRKLTMSISLTSAQLKRLDAVRGPNRSAWCIKAIMREVERLERKARKGK